MPVRRDNFARACARSKWNRCVEIPAIRGSPHASEIMIDPPKTEGDSNFVRISQCRTKYVGLCPTPHLRCFFEKKHLKNSEKASKINFIVGFCPTTKTESAFIGRLKGVFCDAPFSFGTLNILASLGGKMPVSPLCLLPSRHLAELPRCPLPTPKRIGSTLCSLSFLVRARGLEPPPSCPD